MPRLQERKHTLMNTAKKRMVLLLSAVLLLSVLAGCSREEPAAGTFSSFTANTLDGGTFTQDDITSKDLTIINYWGMFCSPCRAEMPDLAAYAKALPDNVQLITICIDASDDPEGTKEFLNACGYEGVTLVSGDASFTSLMNQVQAFPTTIFVDSRGEVAGDSIIGGQPDLAAVYTAAANKILKAAGKAELNLA